jgi:hypothetical protein
MRSLISTPLEFIVHHFSRKFLIVPQRKSCKNIASVYKIIFHKKVAKSFSTSSCPSAGIVNGFNLLSHGLDFKLAHKICTEVNINSLIYFSITDYTHIKFIQSLPTAIDIPFIQIKSI